MLQLLWKRVDITLNATNPVREQSRSLKPSIYIERRGKNCKAFDKLPLWLSW